MNTELSDPRRVKLMLVARESGRRKRETEAEERERQRNSFLEVEERCIPHRMHQQRRWLRLIGINATKLLYNEGSNTYLFVADGKVVTPEQMAAARAARQAEAKADKRARRNEWFRERASADPVFKLNRNVRHAVNQSLSGAKNGRKWQTLVGYSLAELKAHIEAQFAAGMTWENIGEWHVDHIRPLASFNITSAECDDFKQAWALSNLQPLWGPDNLKKGSRWEP